MVDKSTRDLSGLQFGRWKVLEKHTGPGRSTWNCVCACGVSRLVQERELINGKSRSCGCLAAYEASSRNSRHGLTGSGAHRSWSAMMQRCFDPEHISYKRYGLKGITVCERWLSFENFHLDMGDRPEGASLDRFPDPAGNYEPENCRWATPTQQQRNRVASRTLTIRGETKPIAQWCAETGLPYHKVWRRKNSGWPDEACLKE